MKCGYGDSHERSDIVHHCDHIYLPGWATLQKQMQKFSHENLPEMGPYMEGQCVVIWYHDKSIFYAHDHQRCTWFHKDAPAQARPKGDGLSFMVSNFVSADFGWLRSPNVSWDNGSWLGSTWVFWYSWCRVWYCSVCFDGLQLASLQCSRSLDQTTPCCVSVSQVGDKYSG